MCWLCTRWFTVMSFLLVESRLWSVHYVFASGGSQGTGADSIWHRSKQITAVFSSPANLESPINLTVGGKAHTLGGEHANNGLSVISSSVLSSTSNTVCVCVDTVWEPLEELTFGHLAVPPTRRAANRACFASICCDAAFSLPPAHYAQTLFLAWPVLRSHRSNAAFFVLIIGNSSIKGCKGGKPL